MNRIPPVASPTRRRLAIVGGGPVGIECALYGAWLGHEVGVYEAGEVGCHLRQWGHVRMFSPWPLNVSRLGLAALGSGARAGAAFPAGECPTGHKFLERYLRPLVESAPLKGRVHERTRVLAIGRDRLLKAERVGSPDRAEQPFRLLVSEAAGSERVVHADLVIDASGVFSQHNWMGSGGVPAAGERALEGSIDYGLPDVAGQRAQEFAGRRTLVVGAGLSAATMAIDLAGLARREPGTRVVWALREKGRDPYEPVPDDPLPLRSKLMKGASRLLQGADAAVQCLRGWCVEEIRSVPGGGFEVDLSREGSLRHERVDRVIANVGYRPDRSLYEELQVHECFATQGPMRLAAELLGETSTDCLAQRSHGAESLRNPEPDFFILGAKSYGRNPRFLISVGRAQIRDLFRAVERDHGLDLYAAEAA